MMRKNITRTLTRNTISAFTVKTVDGKPDITMLDPVCAYGNLTDKEALKAVKDKYKDVPNVCVGEVKTEDVTYQISVEDFVERAHIVDKDASEDEEENQ